MGRGEQTLLCLVSLVVYLLALALLVGGIAGPYWTDTDYTHEGLWTHCRNFPNVGWKCNETNLRDIPQWFKATAGLIILALLLAAIGGITLIMKPVSALLQTIAGAMILIAIIIYADKARDDQEDGDLGWAFALTTTAGCLFLLNGIFVGVLAKNDGYNLKPTLPCRQ